ncbi:unnamed protein product [Prunus armeniaca]
MSVDFKFSDVVSGNSGSCFRQSRYCKEFREFLAISYHLTLTACLVCSFQTLFRVVGMLVAYVLAPKSEPSSTSGSSRKQI